MEKAVNRETAFRTERTEPPESCNRRNQAVPKPGGELEPRTASRLDHACACDRQRRGGARRVPGGELRPLLATLTTRAVKVACGACAHPSLSSEGGLRRGSGCSQRRPGRHHGEAEQRGQAEAAAALQGRPVRHPLGLYPSRDLPGLLWG
ncbi:mitochondrial import receptor subunit TOM7 homolog isoform X1 [Myotis daubentonii]|uniref:mitochondrial import receptor subunit TOM7 homolog isoform X1 n=1 Tax=Myotis daubentonii TaxID=98922 RepID=UPI002873CFDE|nr:mitochondrial import receptor subunit TOM7 homolog isoform X1 [Myotis daubentonii]